MHICYISREYPPSLRGGGIASYVKEVAEGMARRGHQVTVICASDDTRTCSDAKEDGIRVIRLAGADIIIPKVEGISVLKKFRILYRFRSYRQKIRECVKSLQDVDIIEVPEYGAEGLYLHDLNIPVVVRLHTPNMLDHYKFSILGLSKGLLPYYWQSLKELKEMELARYSTSCSTSLKHWGVKYANMKADRVKVIYNPIDVLKWNVPSEISVPHNDVINILFAGTICDWKGCGELAAAGVILENKIGCKFKISFVGKTGSWSEELRRQYKRYDWFDYVGMVPREELMKRYATADVVVFPSWWENMPMVCLEAMLQGSLVIGSNSGGMSEIIEDGRCGFLVEPRSAEKLAEKILYVISLMDNEKRSIRKNAIERICNHFSTDVILTQVEEYFQHVINDNKKNKK